MFTGIVATTGQIETIEPLGETMTVGCVYWSMPMTCRLMMSGWATQLPYKALA